MARTKQTQRKSTEKEMAKKKLIKKTKKVETEKPEKIGKINHKKKREQEKRSNYIKINLDALNQIKKKEKFQMTTNAKRKLENAITKLAINLNKSATDYSNTILKLKKPNDIGLNVACKFLIKN